MSKGMPEEVTQNFIKQIPLGRLGEANEIERHSFPGFTYGFLYHRSCLERERGLLHGVVARASSLWGNRASCPVSIYPSNGQDARWPHSQDGCATANYSSPSK